MFFSFLPECIYTASRTPEELVVVRVQTGVVGRGKEAKTGKVKLYGIINRQCYTVLLVFGHVEGGDNIPP